MENTSTKPPSLKTPPQQTPDQTGKTKNIPRLVLIGIISCVGLGLLISGGLYVSDKIMSEDEPPTTVTPTSSISPSASPSFDTSSWKTYTSPSGFSIKYPSNVFVRIQCEGEDFLLQKRTTETEQVIVSPTCGRDSRLNVEMFEQDNGYTEPKTSKFANVTQENISVGGTSAIKYIIQGIPNPDGISLQDMIDIFVKQNNKTYSLIFDDEYIQNPELMNQILSTFAFTNAPATQLLSATPLPLKTYKDTDTGFSIKYPQDWTFSKTYGKNIPKQGGSDIVSGIQLDNNVESKTIVINAKDKKDATSITDWWNKYSSERGTTGTVTQPTTTFKSYPAMKTSFTTGANPTRVSENIYFIANGYVYFISTQYPVGVSSTSVNDVVNTFTP